MASLHSIPAIPIPEPNLPAEVETIASANCRAVAPAPRRRHRQPDWRPSERSRRGERRRQYGRTLGLHFYGRAREQLLMYLESLIVGCCAAIGRGSFGKAFSTRQ